MNNQITATNAKSEVSEAILFFSNIFDGTCEESCFNDTLNHVEKYGLQYEVFVTAKSKLDKNPSMFECIEAMHHQLCEWDL